MMHRALLALLTLGALATPAAAQDYSILVTRGDVYGVDQTAYEDLVEESAWLVQDFGGFAVTRWYQMDEVVSRSVESRVLGCASDVGCYVDALFDSQFDYVLVVNAFDEQTEIVVEYQMIDTRVGVLAAQTEAFLPTPQDYAYLMVPCHDALKVTPDWLDPGPVATVPDPPPARPVAPAPLPEPRERADLGQLGRIGAYTAGAGGALFFGGVLLGFGADETQQEIQAEPHPRGELRSLQSKGQRQQRMANAFMILGGAAVVGGATLLVVDHISDDDASVALGTNGTSLWVRAEF